jgi:hypothetical protein
MLHTSFKNDNSYFYLFAVVIISSFSPFVKGILKYFFTFSRRDAIIGKASGKAEN